MMAGPVDAQARIHGLDYKVGVRGLVFVWAGDEWIRSTAVTAEQVRRCAEGPDVTGNPSKARQKHYAVSDYKQLAVGQSIEFPMEERSRISTMVLSHARRFGKKFSTRKISEARFKLERVA